MEQILGAEPESDFSGKKSLISLHFLPVRLEVGAYWGQPGLNSFARNVVVFVEEEG
jgi:hypothetical protein